MEAQLKKAMKDKLGSVGLPFESLNVFGAININVHVTCLGRETADKWAMLLGKVFHGGKVILKETMWDAVDNKNTNLLPTKRHGYLIAIIA